MLSDWKVRPHVWVCERECKEALAVGKPSVRNPHLAGCDSSQSTDATPGNVRVLWLRSGMFCFDKFQINQTCFSQTGTVSPGWTDPSVSRVWRHWTCRATSWPRFLTASSPTVPDSSPWMSTTTNWVSIFIKVLFWICQGVLIAVVSFSLLGCYSMNKMYHRVVWHSAWTQNQNEWVKGNIFGIRLSKTSNATWILTDVTQLFCFPETLPGEIESAKLDRLANLYLSGNQLTGKKPFYVPKFILELPR